MNTTIIGTGVAAWTLVRELRKADPSREIRVITADGGHSYSKPMLSNALASGKTAETLIMQAADKMAAAQSVELLTNTQVQTIDLKDRKIITSAGEFRYDQLVLGLGADTIELPLTGSGAQDVISVNDLDDYAVFRERLAGKSSVAIIGAGLIGCEFANDLAKIGVSATVFDLADRAMPRLLPPEGSHYLQEKLGAMGVNWKLAREIRNIEKTENTYSITDSEGETTEADLVLSAVGLKPRKQLAQDAGIKVGAGIITNKFGQTSDPNVYALGDCAQYFGSLVLPYIMPVMTAARAMAKTLAGEETPIAFPAMPVTVKTPDCPTVVNPPATDAKGDWKIVSTADGLKALFESADGSLLGMALMGEFVKERQSLTPKLPPLA